MPNTAKYWASTLSHTVLYKFIKIYAQSANTVASEFSYDCEKSYNCF